MATFPQSQRPTSLERPSSPEGSPPPNPPATPYRPPNPGLPEVNINSFGYFLDGWSDTIEDMGYHAEDVRASVFNQLAAKKMPNVSIKEARGNAGFLANLFSSERRPYTIVQTSPGANLTIYIEKFGQDLYASWRIFLKPLINRQMIKWLAMIAAGVAVIPSVVTLLISLFFGNLAGGYNYYGYGYDQPLINLGFLPYSFGCFIGSTISIFILESMILLWAGLFFKGHIFYFFYTEPSWFDAEDITAMSLTAHKTLLNALKGCGIQEDRLRPKSTLKGGRRDASL